MSKTNQRRINLTELGALKVLDRRAWEKRIKEAMREHKGRVRYAALDLDVSERQMHRILLDPAFRDVPHAPAGGTYDDA